MQKSGRFAFIAIFLTAFLILQASLVWSTRKTIAEYVEPVLGWSTHSVIAPTHTERATDGDLQTFWSDTGTLQPDLRRPPRPEPYEGLYLMLSVGLSHRPGAKPAPDPISGLQIFTGDAAGAHRPKRIRLSYFEQQLYQINHDYKFPDPPVFVTSQDFFLQDTAAGQSIPLALPAISSSRGFPDQIKQRWIRIEVLEVYGIGRQAAIREVRFVHSSLPETTLRASSSVGSPVDSLEGQ